MCGPGELSYSARRVGRRTRDQAPLRDSGVSRRASGCLAGFADERQPAPGFLAVYRRISGPRRFAAVDARILRLRPDRFTPGRPLLEQRFKPWRLGTALHAAAPAARTVLAHSL